MTKSEVLLLGGAMKLPALTIGMANYRDGRRAWWTIEAIRLSREAAGCEFVVVDNTPGGDSYLRSKCEKKHLARYVGYSDRQGTAGPRDEVFRQASCDWVLCLDPHVLLEDGALAALRCYVADHPGSDDLLQGPRLDDDLRLPPATHWKPTWGGGMWGQWATDERGIDPAAAPFPIPMQGLGLFAARKQAWPGFPRAFRGFGGEEGTLHLAYKRQGAQTLCLPALRWLHDFDKPEQVAYNPNPADRLFNYLYAFGALENPNLAASCKAHFVEALGFPTDAVERMQAVALRQLEADRKGAGR